jgi:hypothetical protein
VCSPRMTQQVCLRGEQKMPTMAWGAAATDEALKVVRDRSVPLIKRLEVSNVLCVCVRLLCVHLQVKIACASVRMCTHLWPALRTTAACIRESRPSLRAGSVIYPETRCRLSTAGAPQRGSKRP